jgi:hypothetical protein
MHYLLFSLIVITIIVVLLFLFREIIYPFKTLISSKYLLIVAFSLVLLLGLIGTFISVKTASVTENRNLEKWSPLKEIHLTEKPKKIESYVNDHFGFRDYFLKIYRFLQFNIFNQSLSDQIIMGRNNWLFLKQAVTVEYLDKPMTKEDIVSTKVIDQFNKFNSYLKDKGIKLILVIIPDKPYIYSEYLPNWINTKSPHRKTIDNFKELLNNNTNVTVLDLYNSLLNAKKMENDILYFKDDTHWNYIGGYYGLKEISNHLNSLGISTKKIQFTDFSKNDFQYCGDLSRMMGITSTYKSIGYFSRNNNANHMIFLPSEVRTALGLKNDVPDWQKIAVNYSGNKDPLIAVPVIVADSYLLASTFSPGSLFAKYYSMQFNEMADGLSYLLDRQKDPNLLILSFVDRQFNAFISALLRWNPNDSLKYTKDGWDQQLPY